MTRLRSTSSAWVPPSFSALVAVARLRDSLRTPSTAALRGLVSSGHDSAA
jgi:hypothetical protein